MFWEVHKLLRALHIMRILCALHALCIPHVLRSALRSALHGLACARVSELGWLRGWLAGWQATTEP